MVVASMPRQAPHGSDELAAADDAPRSEHNGTVPVLHATNPEMPSGLCIAPSSELR